MTQNIYDDPQFFEGYGRLPRSVEGLDGAPEWPALVAPHRNLVAWLARIEARPSLQATTWERVSEMAQAA